MLRLFLPLIAAFALSASAGAQAPVTPAGPKPTPTSADAPGDATATAAPLDTNQLIELLKKGGTVLVIRHERTEVPSIEDDYAQPANCLVQRNLSVAGQAGSRETGYALKALGIRFGRVLSSPMCRTMETARLMFGRAEPAPRLMHIDPPRGRTLAVGGTELRAQIEALRPAAGVNDVAVSHIGNIAAAYSFRLSEGEMAVMTRGTNGQVRLAGRIIPSDLGPSARVTLARAPAE